MTADCLARGREPRLFELLKMTQVFRRPSIFISMIAFASMVAGCAANPYVLKGSQLENRGDYSSALIQYGAAVSTEAMTPAELADKMRVLDGALGREAFCSHLSVALSQADRHAQGASDQGDTEGALLSTRSRGALSSVGKKFCR